MSPFDRVKNQLIVKIKEVHLPTDMGGVTNKLNKLDFTGGNNEE